MNRYLLYCLFFIIVFTIIKALVLDPDSQVQNKQHLYVTTDSLAVHIGETPNSGTIDSYIFFREQVSVYERKEGWVRTTQYFDGKKVNLSGRLAYWVPEAYLNKAQPPEQPSSEPIDEPQQAVPQ